jgi:hypothetical protein
MLSQCLLNRIQFVLCEAKVFPNGDRPIRAIQFKDGLVPVSDYVDVRPPMVIRINDNAKTRKPAGRLAHPNYIKPKRLGYYGQSSDCLGRTRKFVGGYITERIVAYSSLCRIFATENSRSWPGFE